MRLAPALLALLIAAPAAAQPPSGPPHHPPPGPVGPPGPGGGPPSPGARPPPPPGVRPPIAPPPPMRATASLFTQTNFRGRSRTVRTPMSNLAIIHMNDQVRSIRINGRSGPWQICTNANFRGHCAIFTRSVSDTGRFGMRNSVSSIRPR